MFTSTSGACQTLRRGPKPIDHPINHYELAPICMLQAKAGTEAGALYRPQDARVKTEGGARSMGSPPHCRPALLADGRPTTSGLRILWKRSLGEPSNRSTLLRTLLR